MRRIIGKYLRLQLGCLHGLAPEKPAHLSGALAARAVGARDETQYAVTIVVVDHRDQKAVRASCALGPSSARAARDAGGLQAASFIDSPSPLAVT